MRNRDLATLMLALLFCLLIFQAPGLVKALTPETSVNNWKMDFVEHVFDPAVTADTTGDTIAVRGFHHLTLYTDISAGTATVTWQFSPDGTTWWDAGYATTKSYINAEAAAPYTRAVVSSCSSCAVDAWLAGDSY